MKDYASPRISTEYPDCGLPLSFDQYNMCGFGCLYCFAYNLKITDKGGSEEYKRHTFKDVRGTNPERVMRLFQGEGKSKQDKVFYKYFIKPKKVMQWGGLADPFCPFERKFGIGKKLLKFFADIKYPISLSTKGTLCTESDYLSIFKQSPETFHVKFSVITLNPIHAKEIEKGVPSPEERLLAMRKLSDIGVSTTLRLRPFLMGTSEKTYEELITKSAQAGADSVSTEFFCVENRGGPEVKERYNTMSKVLGFNLIRFYRNLSVHKTYPRLNREIKEPYVLRMRELAHKLGMTFHVSGPHFKELGDHGCCCGIPIKNPNFANYCKSQLTEIIINARKNPKELIPIQSIIKGNDWMKEIKAGSPHNFGDKHGHRIHRDQTVLEHFRNGWNDPNCPRGPYHYFTGKMRPVKLDKKGDVVYEYVA